MEEQSVFGFSLTNLYFTFTTLAAIVFHFSYIPLLQLEATIGGKNAFPSAWTCTVAYFSHLWFSPLLFFLHGLPSTQSLEKPSCILECGLGNCSLPKLFSFIHPCLQVISTIEYSDLLESLSRAAANVPAPLGDFGGKPAL